MESKRFSNALPLIPLAVFALALLIVSCAAPVDVKEEWGNLTNPFSSRSESENGIVVEWSGFTHGHQPGKGSAFILVLRNGSEDVWQGRYCIQLLDHQSVVATLKRGEFSLQPEKDWGMQETIHFPEGLSEGAYGVALVVHQPYGPIVNSVTIQVGDTTGVYQPQESVTQAALDACPPVMRGDAEPLVNLSIANLAERLDVGPDEIAVQSVEATEFSDASLGVPEPGKVYAQVITPGYVIRLAVNGTVYEYHGSGDDVVFVPTSSPPVYQKMDIPEVGLAFEVPAGWLRLEPEWAWAPGGDNSLRLGVNWMDIQPPQEVEAALLPTPSQIIHSEPVELGWGSGRRFTVEVYAPAAQGDDTRAPVQSVETHVLIVVSLGDTRRAFDFYASGQTAGQLAILESSLQHMLETSILTD